MVLEVIRILDVEKLICNYDTLIIVEKDSSFLENNNGI